VYQVQEAGMSSIERRLARLNENDASQPSSDRARRRVHRAEVVVESEDLDMVHSQRSSQAQASKRGNEDIAIQPVQVASYRDPSQADAEDMELDEEYVTQRRAELREMLLAKQAARNAGSTSQSALSAENGGRKWQASAEEDEEYEEEEEDDSDEEEAVEMVRPMFVKKSDRSTLVSTDVQLTLAEEERARELAAEELRRAQTVEMMAIEDAKEEEAKMDLVDGNISDIEKNDDPEEEFELWKIRELKRLKRDRDAQHKLELEREGVEARKHMTDAEVMRERREEARRNRDASDSKETAERRSLKPMQRSYHKGAFFKDTMDELTKTHDWNAPTGADNWFNRETGPDSVKYKRYGASAANKAGSLREQDTSRTRSSPPYQELRR
jgi:microfibrillar-associated protein 1